MKYFSSVVESMHVEEGQLVWEGEGKTNTCRVAGSQQARVPGVATPGVGGCVGGGCSRKTWNIFWILKWRNIFWAGKCKKSKRFWLTLIRVKLIAVRRAYFRSKIKWMDQIWSDLKIFSRKAIILIQQAEKCNQK